MPGEAHELGDEAIGDAPEQGPARSQQVDGRHVAREAATCEGVDALAIGIGEVGERVPEGGGDLVLIELLLRPEERDPIGQYRYNLRLTLGVVNPGEMTAPVMAAPGQTNDETVTVTTFNPGIFLCTIDATSFDFGDVDVQGANYGTVDVVANGRNGSDTGGEYESRAGAIGWTCSVLPSSIVSIALVSSAADHTGGMGASDLEVRIPTVAGGTTTGYRSFTSGDNLITGMSVGIGANAAHGHLDLRLTVLDTDPPGANAWLVRLRATGNP